LVAALKTGRKVEDFEIGRTDDRKSRRQHG
jgi:hypothetical protein